MVDPGGKAISGKPPANLHGHHFGPQLQAYALVQHHGCAVTQPQLLELLWDIYLSESQIREHVKRRKISGGTRSDAGRQSRDTFAPETCLHGLAGGSSSHLL